MMQNNYLSNEEHFRIARELEKHHAIFERIWTMSRIRFTKKVPTAGVLFNKRGDCIDFIINREFWEAQSFNQKCFVLAHECMHIALNHGHRGKELYKNKTTQMISNFAQDLVINHALVNRYGFVREEIDPPTEEAPLGRYCWKDKLLPNRDDLSEEENYELYFNEIMKDVQKAADKLKEMLENSETVDDHGFNQGQDQGGIPIEGDSDGSGGKGDQDEDGKDGDEIDKDDYDFIDMDDYTDDFSDAIDKLDEELTGDEKETLKNFIEENETPEGESKEIGKGGPQKPGPNTPGTKASGMWTFAKTPPPKKRKWESIVTDWAKKRMTETYKEVDQWVHTNRRFSLMDTGLHLPTEYEVLDEFEEEDLIQAWFFQDTSGSCAGYKDRFFSVAESMPEEKFEMQLFCFDTKIYETDLVSKKLYGFGGTYFHIIEEYIQARLTENPKLKYPDAVFVITDGWGDDVRPEKPQNWHWILTPGASKENFPDTCNTYDLAKYE